MVVFSRDLARRFRVVARKCTREWRRRAPPTVTARVHNGTLTLSADVGDASPSVVVPARGRTDGVLAFPLSVLEAAGGTTAELVEVSAGAATWTDRGTARTYPFDPPAPVREPRGDDPDLVDAPASLLSALHECGRTAGGETGRFATHTVQVRGRAGTVAGTDAKQALVCGGFTFPFADDVLVPAVPVFGTRELADAGDVRVGLTASHLVVRAGLWTVRLGRLSGARFPDVAAAVPRHPSTTLTLTEADARALAGALPALPGADGRGGPVTLDVTDALVVRAAGDGRVVELDVAGAGVTGVPVRAAVDRAYLVRALALGCRTVRLAGPGKPLVAEANGRTYLVATLAPDEAVPPGLDAERRSAGVEDALPPPGRAAARRGRDETVSNPEPERRCAVIPRDTNGHPPDDRHDPPAECPDPLAEAEALRSALSEAAARAGRLVAALKRGQKEKKALSAVWSSLRGLNLGTGGGL